MADFEGYTLPFLICLVSFILVRTIFFKNRTTSRLPPSPMALPIIGHFHLLGQRLPHQDLYKLSTKHGPLMHIRLGSIQCLVVSSPETAELLLKTHESSFLNRPITAATDYLSYGSADFSFTPYGPYWKFMRKISMSQLLNGRMLDRFKPVRHEELSRFLQFMLKKAKASEKVDVRGELVRLTNNILSRMTMSRTCSNDENEVQETGKVLREIADLNGHFSLSDYIWFCKYLGFKGVDKKLIQVRDKFDAMMDKIIKEHEEAKAKERGDEGTEVKDILDVLLDISQDESSEMRLTRENIKGYIMDIFVAGTDTSTIEWALCELINHPATMKKAREEIDIVVGKKKIVQESDITNLPYLQAIIKETSRLHPVGPLILKESNEDCSIGDYEIPEKTRLLVNIWAIGRDSNHWEKPSEFRPERFMEGNEATQIDLKGQHFQLLPFGSGRRSCPAITMALQVMHITLAVMVQCFDWEVVDGINIGTGSVDMEEHIVLTLRRAKPLMCVPILKLNPFPSC